MDDVDREALERRLRRALRGAALFDGPRRRSRAGQCEEPGAVGVVVPADEVDIVASLTIARDLLCPVRVLGAGDDGRERVRPGTLLLDLRRNWHAVSSVDAARRRVHVRSGATLAAVNHAVARFGLCVPLDADTSESATVGALVARGMRGVRGFADAVGAGVDTCVLSLDAWLDGPQCQRFGPFGKQGGTSLDAAAERERITALFTLLGDKRAAIARHWPHVPGPVGGHAWQQLAQVSVPGVELRGDGDLNLAALQCGARGELGMLRSIELRLVPVPRRTLWIAEVDGDAGLRRWFANADALRTVGAVTVQLVDGAVLRSAWRKARCARALALAPLTCWVECDGSIAGSSPDVFDRRMRALAQDCGRGGRRVEVQRVDDAARIESLWALQRRTLASAAVGGRVREHGGCFGVCESVVPPAVAADHVSEVITMARARLGALGIVASLRGNVLDGAINLDLFGPADRWCDAGETASGRRCASVSSATSRASSAMSGASSAMSDASSAMSGASIRGPVSRRLDAQLHEFAIQMAERTWRRRGSAIASHGGGLAGGFDARSREALMRAQFGEELAAGFATLRQLFDPAQRFAALPMPVPRFNAQPELRPAEVRAGELEVSRRAWFKRMARRT